MRLEETGEGVFVARDAIVRLGRDEVAFLKEKAGATPRRRARICAHKSGDDSLHEMFIALAASTYIHPHKHIGKSESFHIVEGEVDIVVFDEDGAVREIIELGDPGSGRRFYYRVPEQVFHTLIIRSDVLVVHEVTTGPFRREQTIMAPFAPSESDVAAARAYMEELKARLATAGEQADAR